ncbi:MAG TPA: WG repeat-containing protein [Spirochaetota bacterium]|nr:WG repeat-containing protein [Spirochaetota bacterium]
MYAIRNIISALIIAVLFNSMLMAQTTKLYPIQIGTHAGFVDESLRIAVKPQFIKIGNTWSEGLMVVCTAENKWGYIDTTGTMVIQAIYEEAYSFKDNLAVIKYNGSYGLINTKGETVIEPIYDDIGAYREKRIAVKINGKWGFINLNGITVIEPIYDEVGSFSYNMAVMKIDNQYGFIDYKGKIVIKPVYEEANSFIDKEYPNKSDLILAAVKINGKWGYINTDNKFIINPTFSEATPFWDDLAAVCNSEGKWGHINKKGEEIIKPQYDMAIAFTTTDGGLAKIKNSEGKWGYIDKTGKIVIKPQFDNASEFYGSYTYVQLGSLIYLIDRTGKIVFDPENFDDTNIEYTDEEINMNFIRACENGNLEKVKQYLKRGADLNYKNDSNRTPLMYASTNGSLEIVKFLLTKKINVNYADRDGVTALFLSIPQNRDNIKLQKNKLEIMRLLIKKGANVNSKITMGYFGKITILQLIKFNNSEAEAKDNKGDMICPEAINILKKAGAK